MIKVHSQTVKIDTSDNFEIINLTSKIKSALSASEIKNGIVTISSKHTTTALFVNEYEERLLDDIKNFLKQLIPSARNYRHNDIHLRDCPADEPQNAHSHLMAMLLNNNEIIPVVDGELSIGRWQSILFAELDGPRKRTVQLQVIGE